MRKRRRGSGEGEQDFELNLASIIDCFTVLVTYLLVSASFISLGVLDVGLVSTDSGKDKAQAHEPTATLSILMDASRTLIVKATGIEEKSISIPPRNGGWAFDALADYLAPLKIKWPDLTTGIVAADGTIDYRDVVHAVEVTKHVLPTVFLGGREVE